MKLNKFDIGGEIISILTRGMYPDPRDAVREYIQNGVDANAKNIQVKVRLNSVVVQDDGIGMDYKTLRKALRIGISDKNPKSKVGFMGIGIYSAFHLCDRMTITTRQSEALPLRLEMNFKGMKEVLDIQKALRIEEKIDSEQITDLQTLLEDNILLTEEGVLQVDDFPHQGTWVELEGLDPILYDYLIDFDSISSYLQQVVPLHFEKEEVFKWGPHIEKEIDKSCQKHKATFKRVNLKLRVNNQSADLFRPYKDTDFHNKSPQKPKFKDVKNKNTFLGVVWGCLNSDRKRIVDKEKRGFLLKKQGFAVGEREKLSKYFTRNRSYFDRYIGEVIILNSNILPNAARNDLEISDYKTMFDDIMYNSVAPFYKKIGKDFQHEELAKEKLEKMKESFKSLHKEYTEFEENTETLIIQVNLAQEIIDGIDLKKLPSNKREEGRKVKEQALEQQKAIKERYDLLLKKKKTKKIDQQKKKREIAKELSKLSIPQKTEVYNSLLDLVKDLDFEVDNNLEVLFNSIDEKFVQALGKSKMDYKRLLNELKSDFLNSQETL